MLYESAEPMAWRSATEYCTTPVASVMRFPSDLQVLHPRFTVPAGPETLTAWTCPLINS